MSDKELKPCPFCGKKPDSYSTTTGMGTRDVIECINIDCAVKPKIKRFVMQRERTSIEKAWNDRPVAKSSHRKLEQFKDY